MEKGDKSLKENLVRLITKNDCIANISETFNIFNEAKLPIEFFDGLSELLLYHAIKNENLRAQKNIYCEILSKILSSTNMMGTPTYNAALRNLLVLTRDSLLFSRGATMITNNTFELRDSMDKQQLISLVQLCTQVLSIVICSDPKSYLNSNVSAFVGLLPQVLRFSLDSTSVHFLEAFSRICQEIISNRLDDCGYAIVEDLLIVILQALKEKGLSKETTNIYASIASNIAFSDQAFHFNDEWKLSYITNELAFDPDSSSNIAKLNAIKDISKMLSENGVPTPWLDSQSSFGQDRGIEYHTSSTHTNQASPDNVQDIVKELISLQTKDDRADDLLSKLNEIAKRDDISILCQPKEKELTEFVVRMLPIDPSFAESIINLFDYEIPQYIRVYLQYAIPYAVIQADDKAINAIAQSLEVSTEYLCQKCAHDVLVSLYMQEDPSILAYGTKRLQQFTNKKVKDLARDGSARIVPILAMNLGVPDCKYKALEALSNIKRLTRHPKEQLAEYISNYFIAILEKISKFLSDKRNQVKHPQNPYALAALMEVMTLLKSKISDHVYLMNTFESVSELPGMQLEALRLWEHFISLMNSDSLKTHLNGITQGLSHLISVVAPVDRIKVADILGKLLMKDLSLEPIQCTDLPTLPNFEELEKIKIYINEKKLKRSTTAQRNYDMKQIIISFSNADTIQVQLGLKKLKELLEVSVDCEPFTGDLYSRLLHLLQKYASHQEISYLTSACLGKLGAIDPGLVNVRIIDDTVFIMNNFGRLDENVAFICDVIISHIYPAYNTVRDDEVRQSFEYSIQTLLKEAGFEPLAELKRNSPKISVYHHWRRLPKWTQEFLMPFLQSHYHISMAEYRGSYPIFSRTKTFEDWVHGWYCQMTHDAHSPAKEYFAACIPISECRILGVTIHLMPYLVLHIILSGSPDDTRNIVEEIISVLNTNADPDTNPARSHINNHALQVVVAITEYCRKFLTRIGPNDLEKKSQADRVRNFLKMIPNKIMGIAAYHTKTYPQALMQFETYIKENNIDLQEDDDILDYLRQIFIQIDDPVDLEVLLSIYTNVLTQEQEIVRYEAVGQWEMAEALYETKLARDPSDLSACMGYMDCFKKSGNYGNLIYAANKLLDIAPKWQPQLNSFRIDSAWRIKDWNTVTNAANSPIQRDIQALIGCTLNSAMKSNDIDVACLLEESRHTIIKQMTMSAAHSYRKAYPQLFNLQMLNEIEEAQKIWNSSDPEQKFNHLQKEWKRRSKLLIPSSQYELNLLQLRKAAFFDIRQSAHLKKYESKLWQDISKAYRKAGKMALALSALENAIYLGEEPLLREKAKLLWKSGFKDLALGILETKYKNETIKPSEAMLVTRIYQEDMKLKGDEIPGPKLRGYLQHAMKITEPEKLEKAYHNSITYFSNVFRPQHTVDENRLRVMDYLIRTSVKALYTGSKYYYSSMSTFINTWFEFVKLQKEAEAQLNHPLSKTIKKYADRLPGLIDDAIDRIPTHQWILFLTRLISHLSTDNETVANHIRNIVGRVFAEYPRNTIWLMIGQMDPLTPKVSRSIQMILDKAMAKNSNSIIPTIIKQATTLKAALHALSSFTVDPQEDSCDLSTESELSALYNLRDLELFLPKENILLPSVPEIIRTNAVYKPFREDFPKIKRFEKNVVVMRSLQRPKRISIVGSDGKTYRFLVKAVDDMRKDARVMEFNHMINSFLKRNKESRDIGLYIRTYAVIPLGPAWGLIEWIDNLVPLKGVVNDIWVASGNDSVHDQQVRYNSAYKRLSLGHERTKFFEESILPRCPSVFYKWFLDTFPEPNQWLNSRTRYVKTLAVMSIVGHIVGLGDRHAENVTFDSTNGDCVHVDLNMLFDSGRDLPVPECVPFRLTHNLVGAMGVLGYKGLFQHTCEITLSVLLSNKDSLISVFQTYINEKEYSENPRRALARPSRSATKHIMPSLREKVTINSSEVKDTVNMLIDKATSKANLAQLYPGWAAYI